MQNKEVRSSVEHLNKKAYNSGPYLARVVGHLDPTSMGKLKVRLIQSNTDDPSLNSSTIVVNPAMPFYGYTGYEFMGSNGASDSNSLNAFNDTQKSYGMWFVPPDIGVVVIVVFIEGNVEKGYWIACVPSNYTNTMVPAIGAIPKDQVDMDDSDAEKYGDAEILPVAEMNRRKAKDDNPDCIFPEDVKRVVHPIAERFLEQGLVEDDVRGPTTSSARRNVPSSVFGISSPGPRDKRGGAKKGKVGFEDEATEQFVSRLGGTIFVMDDGDEKFQRKEHASELGYKEDAYASLEDGDTGDPTIPFNECFRIRTRTGHQLLLHNSEDLIYVGNSRGTTWIELTSDGKIDIFAEDSISIRTKVDVNLTADRDINFDVGRDFNVNVGRDFKTFVENDKHTIVENDSKEHIQNEKHTIVESNHKITNNDDFCLDTSNDNNFTAGSNTNIKTTGNHRETAKRITMNGPQAKAATSADEPEEAKVPARVPEFEPWEEHENNKPNEYKPDKTEAVDRD